MLECVINVSEGRDVGVITELERAVTPPGRVLDIHSDPHHHRSVFTLLGVDAAYALSAAALARIDLRGHRGAHPRMGAVDVVPFVPLDDATILDAEDARDDFARWAGNELGVPCFTYGAHRTLPEVRRLAFGQLPPDTGPRRAHPTAGAIAVGARPLMVAYNVWLREPDVATARRIAAELRSPAVRALGLAVGARAQVSMNLLDPSSVGPAEVFEVVAGRVAVDRGELVGLAPRSVVEAVDPERWDRLDLHPDRTIEARRARAST